MMFLAHFTGDGILNVLEMDAKDIKYWHVEALKLHNELHDSDQ